MIETQDNGSYSTISYPFFFLFPYCMSILQKCVRVFSGTVVASVLKNVIHMDNELLYCGIENLTHFVYSFLYLCIFKAKFVPQFS